MSTNELQFVFCKQLWLLVQEGKEQKLIHEAVISSNRRKQPVLGKESTLLSQVRLNEERTRTSRLIVLSFVCWSKKLELFFLLAASR